MKKRPTLVLYHPIMAQEGYPVLAGRLKPTIDYLRKTGTLESPLIQFKEPVPVADSLLREVHSIEHITRVGRTGYDSAAKLSAGATVQAGEAVWLGEAANAFVFTGCAGHHASRDSAWGFCYYNNSALLVRYLQQTYDVRRFFIVDTDPHTGDGTREILGKDSSVYHLNFYASYGEVSKPKFEWQVDVPIPSSCSDGSFIEALERLTHPLAVLSEAEILLWNMGHDAHQQDYGGFNLSLQAFPTMTKILASVAEKLCKGRFVVVLSGGSEAFVARHVISGIIRMLAGLSPLPEDVAEDPVDDPPDVTRATRKVVDTILESLNLNSIT